MAVNITYFVHGTTIDNIKHKATGWLDGELSKKGIEQSILLKEQIDINKYEVIFCSDLQRAITSAKYTFGDLKPILPDKRLRECNYGDLNGKDSKLVEYEKHINNKFPNGEAMIDVERRIREFCNDLKKNYDNKEVAIVAHRAPQLALQVITENKTWEEVIRNDWRRTKSWQPGWSYVIEKEITIDLGI